MRVFSKSNNTVGIKSHYCFSVWSLYQESSSNDIESVYCKWAGCTLQAGLGAYCIEAGMWVCGEEGEDEQKKGQARAGGTDSRDRFCGFQVCSSRKLCPGLVRHLQSFLFGNFKEAYFVVELVDGKMPSWRETKDGIQEFDSQSMVIKWLLKWRQNVGWQCSTKKKRWSSQLDQPGFDATGSRKPPCSLELCLRTCKLLKTEEINVSQFIHPLRGL